MTHTNFSEAGLNGSEMLAAAGPSCRPARFVNNPPADRRMRPVFRVESRSEGQLVTLKIAPTARSVALTLVEFSTT